MKRNKAYAFVDAVKRVREILSDDVALENIAIFPDWEIGKALSVSDRVEHEGKLYKVIQAHITQETWMPNVTPTLFEPIDVTNDGSLDRPFVATTGMTYYKDKYYLDETDGNVYLCTRDDTENGTVLHYMPHELVGVYFSLVE